MTATVPASTSAAGTTDERLDEVFAPIFARIAEGAVAREDDRRLAHDEVSWLREAKFGALRVPVELGGYGASVRQLFRLLIDLATAESNLPQALRVHWSFVEDQLAALPDHEAERWLRKVAEGTLVGNAITEPGVGAIDRYQTRLTADGDSWRLDGTKYYSTGSLYSDHILVAADQDGERVSVLVDADAEGVTQHDDWDGFGQRLTASGTTEFSGVQVSGDRILGPGYGVEGRTYATSYLQLVQLSVLAGIAQRATDDVSEWVRERTRTFTHSTADLPRHDPLVQQVIGRLTAAAYSARTIVLDIADQLDRLAETAWQDEKLLDEVEFDVARAQATVIPLVLDATTQLFEVGGASITSERLRLDRHWRNARVISVHNPLIFKLQAIGDHVLNGTELPYAWSAGQK
ncbi:acyl-CoA dehydrogenase family protein [Gordonia amicalis]|uniref:Acyl-CoA dehydrogenase family protein n=1 Tax=Gordonia amicalis TaxID=89053 RepID=A0ABU4DFK6_9ACTN|nr:acyl-CoA dehydrogenase family protein [Gordonia amicalis]MDV6308440.1 acyl-CoA dehydrogenase family protein [Gordonia amicalis]MDV7100857.1 acyl-CoA dehydrogenase family protein [Gordonia amicalis]NKX77977.1 acyl-CoA dehydrogenase [Gordonia amicalis]GAC52921.1 putative acyl-CoA dehydrogenase [Gordonia amicalis NBRC 100051 = JCM 11271]